MQRQMKGTSKNGSATFDMPAHSLHSACGFFTTSYLCVPALFGSTHLQTQTSSRGGFQTESMTAMCMCLQHSLPLSSFPPFLPPLLPPLPPLPPCPPSLSFPFLPSPPSSQASSSSSEISNHYLPTTYFHVHGVDVVLIKHVLCSLWVNRHFFSASNTQLKEAGCEFEHKDIHDYRTIKNATSGSRVQPLGERACQFVFVPFSAEILATCNTVAPDFEMVVLPTSL